jgi:nicotinamide-nucleotide amidase
VAEAGILATEIPPDVEASVAAVLDTACAAGLRLATAESCTGGLLASLLTDVEGRSHAFERGFVVYTDAAKQELLAVPAGMLAAEGAVSEAAAAAMAEGALDRSSADIALAITGYAGPTDDGGEEGLVHLACARRGGRTVQREAHLGAIGRGPIRTGAVRIALGMLAEAMS